MTKDQGKKITINQLAEMMQRSFAYLEEKMGIGFKKVDERFDRLEMKFDLLEAKVNVNHENRITRIEEDVRVSKLN
jgi:hypothetical protein